MGHVLLLVPSGVSFLGLQRVYLSFRSNYRLTEGMWWVEMKGQIFFTSWACDNQ